MMKTREDKVKKKVWDKPLINTLSFQQTLGGGAQGTEDFYAQDAKS